MKPVIVGTAGHIDHGKTTLVKALTGIDADRLDEEKRRGITIDLGFAHLELPGTDGAPVRLGFIDVPGHERFVRNMLAGVGGIDIVLFVVAADEGIKPQTREHFDICRLLAVKRGITVLTKADAVDAETLAVVQAEVTDFLRGSFLDTDHAPIIPVSASTGAGLETLKSALVRLAAEVAPRDAAAFFRLPIDRVFVIKGHGTVVTGTLIAGSVQKEDEVEVFPRGERIRVRSVQVHDQTVEQAVAGQRTALNLAGVSKEELTRGMMLAAPGVFRATDRVDASVTLLGSARPLKDKARVHFHGYTAEMIAEVTLLGEKELTPGRTAFVQLRLAEPTLLLPGDRFILRQFSPVITIGGGVVADNAPLTSRAGVDARLAQLRALLEEGSQLGLMTRVSRRGVNGMTLSDAVAETGQSQAIITSLTTANGFLTRFEEVLITKSAVETVRRSITAVVEALQKADPLAPGVNAREISAKVRVPQPVFDAVLKDLIASRVLEFQNEVVRKTGSGAMLSPEDAAARQTIDSRFLSSGLTVPGLNEVLAALKMDRTRAQKIVTLMLRDGTLVKLGDDLVFHREALATLKERVRGQKARSPKIDVGAFKGLTGVSRKYAIPLLEWLDRERVTRRAGDAREIL
jgi:selenocysteine-specific elongation factor